MFEIPEKLVGSHSKFKKEALSILGQTTQKIISENREEWGQITLNIILNEGQRTLNRKRDPKEEPLAKILEGFFEIESSYNSLKETPYFLRQLPGKLPSKSKYLELVITGYLNETYILTKRIEAYTTKISRDYKTDKDITDKIKKLVLLGKKLSEYFNIINAPRSHHVHQNRYKDDDLDRLVFLELFINDISPFSKKIIPIYKKSLAENKKKWLKYFQIQNETFEKIFDMYFAVLYDVIFDDKKEIRLPKRKTP